MNYLHRQWINLTIRPDTTGRLILDLIKIKERAERAGLTRAADRIGQAAGAVSVEAYGRRACAEREARRAEIDRTTWKLTP